MGIIQWKKIYHKVNKTRKKQRILRMLKSINKKHQCPP